jgi:hypothetical protein
VGSIGGVVVVAVSVYYCLAKKTSTAVSNTGMIAAKAQTTALIPAAPSATAVKMDIAAGGQGAMVVKADMPHYNAL